jgi:hypothetical protein
MVIWSPDEDRWDERRVARRMRSLAVQAGTLVARGSAMAIRAFAIAARTVENAGSGLMNARRRATSEG